MSNSVVSTLENLAPVAITFAAGVLFARKKIIGADTSKAFSEFAFRFAIPAYLLGSLYKSNLRQVFQPTAIAAYAATAVVSMILVALAARTAIGADTRGSAMRIMAACQVNTAYYAVPVFILLFGNPAPIFPVILLQVCVLTVVVIAIMESADSAVSGRGIPWPNVRKGAVAALTTPVVVSCYGGITANAIQIPLPEWLLDSLSFAGGAAAPVALFALGLHLGGSGLRWQPSSRDEYWLIGFKCIAFPALAWVIGRWVFGLGEPWLGYIVLIAAMPAPQNLFIFAQRYDADVDLAASVVVKTSILSLFLLPLWAWLAV